MADAYQLLVQKAGQREIGDAGHGKKKSRSSRDAAEIKRRCVSTACIACRRRKSKCDGQQPSCAACSSVYGTECVYDPNSDLRRKGIYREKADSLKTNNTTLQILIQAILNYAEEDVPDLVRQLRTCENLDDVADTILKAEQGLEDVEDNFDEYTSTGLPMFESQLAGKMGELRLENGSVRFLGGTSNLIYLDPSEDEGGLEVYQQNEPLTSWTNVTTETAVVVHLINMYFTWHYPYFTTLSKSLFYRDFLLGKQPGTPRRTMYCSSLLVNAMLALGCHFTNSPAAMTNLDTATKGDAFFAEAKKLIIENDEYEKPKLTTIQALCLMSVREAGCGREGKGWVYSGMAFRMAQDMGLNLDSSGPMAEEEIDAHRITFWGCFLFDKCWSNYLGRLPQLPISNITVPKYDVFPDEDADVWSQYTDNGIEDQHSQVSRTRTIALQISRLCEISSDLLIFFYHPHHLDKSVGKSQELKKLSELQTRLEAWRKALPHELDAKEGQLPNVLLMHMFFHLLFIHLFRPFLKYNPTTSPLPSHVSPRKLCTQAAQSISKLMRLYKNTYGLRQICNIAVYIVHSACTIHLLNLPDKIARRDIIHGVKHLEEIAQDWLCARRTLSILSVLARKWKIELPDEASVVFTRTDAKYGTFSTADVPSPKAEHIVHAASSATLPSHASQAAPADCNVVLPIKQKKSHLGLKSYQPESKPVLQPQPGQHYQNTHTHPLLPQQMDNITSTMNIPNDSLYAPDPRNTPSTGTATPGDGIPASFPAGPNSNPATSTLPKQGTEFGGVEELIQSQDWWLRDQANLAMGFDNWDMTGLNGIDGAGIITSGEVDPVAGFYMASDDTSGCENQGWTAYDQ